MSITNNQLIAGGAFDREDFNDYLEHLRGAHIPMIEFVRQSVYKACGKKEPTVVAASSQANSEVQF